jgi:DNA-directed RNA polymerase subunit RPC12/RpoP
MNSKKKCPHCGGDLIKSRSHHVGYTSYFWQKPWGKGLLDKLSSSMKTSKVFPWACMECGRVFLYMDEGDHENVKKEYEREKYRF